MAKPPGKDGKRRALRDVDDSGFEDPNAPLPPPPKVSQRPAAEPRTAPAPRAAPGRPAAPSGPTKFQKKALKSTFLDDKKQRATLASVLGTPDAPIEEELEELPDDLDSLGIDGVEPVGAVTSRDLWKAIEPKVQSREGRRTVELYRLVIDQFAVGHNPRYEPDGPDKPRAHIFIWDLTRAMGVEIPHFVGIKEQNLAQTCDWLRLEGPMRGWRRADASGAIEAAQRGEPTLVMPKEIRIKLVAAVLPDAPGADGRPLLSGAGLKRGNRLTIPEVMGVYSVEYFTHV